MQIINLFFGFRAREGGGVRHPAESRRMAATGQTRQRVNKLPNRPWGRAGDRELDPRKRGGKRWGWGGGGRWTSSRPSGINWAPPLLDNHSSLWSHSAVA